jgi:Rrf2 family protein
MLKLSKKVDYGLIALMHLARHTERNAWSAREIAELYDLPAELLAKILQKMVPKGVLTPSYGMNGGYALAKPATEISAAEVLEAIEGAFSLTECIPNQATCQQFAKCTVKTPLQRLNDNVVNMLRQTSLAEMCGQWSPQCQTSRPPVAGESLSRLRSAGEAEAEAIPALNRG